MPNFNSTKILGDLLVTGNSNLESTSLKGQLTSLLPTGTSPFIIASTTRVENLNVDRAGYSDYANLIATTQKSDSVNYQIPFVTLFTAGNQAVYTDNAANLTYNPSTNTLTTTTFVGALTGTASGNLTSLSTLDASKLSGTIPSGVLGNSSLNIGTTSIALNRSSVAQALTGITSIDGSASTLTTTRTL